ncbi:MAG: amino acid ABC transporter permease [Alphaproteobacteria bacterium]|nr:amino acid ABC transporter permease [Alphaproteobacteria bacterium]
METVWEWFRWLDKAHGIDLSVFYDAGDRHRFLMGFLTTILLSMTCLVSSLAIGFIGAWAQQSRFRPARLAVGAFIQFFRNTPPLVQLYFFYFAIGGMLPKLADASGMASPMFGSFFWAAVSLSLFGGAFNIEIFRAGIEAVPRATIEAAESLGFSKGQIFRLVAFPLALRFSLRALNNNMVNLVKTTSLAYAIGVPELLYVSAQIWSDQLNTREMMTLLLFSYVGLVGAMVWGMHRLERALRMPGYGQ